MVRINGGTAAVWLWARPARSSLLAAAVLAAMTGWPARASETAVPVLVPVEPPFTVAGDLAPGPAMDISGIACAEPTGPASHCLVINDEGQDAQFVTIEDRRLLGGAVVPLLDGTPVGRPVAFDGCRKEGKSNDVDGEGAAFAARSFYVVGSHGCSRRKDKFQPSSLVLARIDVGAAGGTFGSAVRVETTYRLADALLAQPRLRPFFTVALDEADNGLNIEGVAVIGNRLFAGLRAPSLNGDAFLVAADVDALFAPGEAPLVVTDPTHDLIAIHLGADLGIRDLTPLPDGRLLVLAGPAQEQRLPASLFVVEPRPGGTVTRIGVLADLPARDTAGKAEAVTLRAGGTILVLFDSLPNGGPREYTLPPW